MFLSLKPLRHQQGSMLVIAIFILTVMALLGLTITRVLNHADNSVSIEVLGTRAFFAAQSGADIGLAILFPVGKKMTSCAEVEYLNTLNNKKPINNNYLPNVVGFKSCKLTLSCKSIKVTFQGENIIQYTITSSATCGENDLRVNRQVQVEARSNA